MDRPGGADDRLLVAHDDVAGLIALAHEVHHEGILGQVEVEIDLHAAVMGVAGHGVPHGAGLQLGHAHHQLAGLHLTGQDVLADGAWENIFKVKPAVFTAEEKRAWLDKNTGVALGSDAFFPFGDNVERAHRSGVSYIAQPGGSIRDDHVIDTCNKYNIAMAFTGIRLFHH